MNQPIRLLVKGIKPLSVNESYMATSYTSGSGYKGAKIAPSPALTNYKEEMSALFEKAYGDRILDSDKLYTLRLIFSLPKLQFYYKNGKIRKQDTSNFIKPLEDIISQVIRVDDSKFVKVSSEKYFNDTEEYYIAVEISEHIEALEFNTLELLNFTSSD